MGGTPTGKIDASGNMVLALGREPGGISGRDIAFEAHMDEIGHRVSQIESDGRLRLIKFHPWLPLSSLHHLTGGDPVW